MASGTGSAFAETDLGDGSATLYGAGVDRAGAMDARASLQPGAEGDGAGGAVGRGAPAGAAAAARGRERRTGVDAAGVELRGYGGASDGLVAREHDGGGGGAAV